MTTYLTADPHINHGNIIKYTRRDKYLEPHEIARLDAGDENWKVRSESIAAMNADILYEINLLVQTEDTLWILGDIGLGGNYEEIIRNFRKEIQCRTVNIIMGNHDRKAVGQFFSNCDHGIPKMVECVIDEQELVLTHRMEYFGLPKIVAPKIHCYGHSHAYYEVERDNEFPKRRSIDVGIDNAFRLFGAYRPFLLSEIVEIVNKR